MTVGYYSYSDLSGSCMYVNPLDVDDSCFTGNDRFINDFNEHCAGRKSCDFEFSLDYFETTDEEDEEYCSLFVDKDES
jgi:hypothetical protein